MPKAEESGIRVYLRIRPPPTAQQSRLLASSGVGNKGGSADVSSSITAVGSASAGSGSVGPHTCQYEIEDDFNKSILHLHTTQRLLQDAQRSVGVGGPAAAPTGASASLVHDDVVNNTTVDFRYRFDRVFKPEATQEDVFNTVAKDCVASVLDGLNSTVFAYGQTGSGKTFSITGGTESYQDRGLIPRAMAMIYEEVARRREGSEDAATTFNITMSYLQIYNDKGQDLLNHGHDARTLEELPPVTIHEMEDDIVLKGLEQHSAPTLSDALNLLFLGDTNRLYCETPMNKTSSRSHCIFTVYVEARSTTSSTVRRSKLNLVDLAGSERVSKTGVSGTILTEAKHINLSLHFLEQVIVALSEKAKGMRDHIPYRNSFLTMVLRDSLGRNCKTAMLATAHVVASQVAETISTCQFAQRVAVIQQAPQVNIETDPALLVRKLKAEVAQLKDEVAYLRANGGGGGDAGADRVLTDDEKGVCRHMVDTFVKRAAVDGDWDSRLTGLSGDLARMYYCYDVLRERLIKGGSPAKGGETSTVKVEEQRALLEESAAQIEVLRKSVQLKENELQVLLTVLKRAGMSGGGGGAGGGLAGARFNAFTQTQAQQTGSGSNSNNNGGGGEAAALSFTDAVLSAEADAELRQRIYHEAQQLIRQLRRTAGASGTDGGGALPAEVVMPNPAMSRVAAEAAAQAALTRVTMLAQQGQLTEAEAFAATEFLESKKGLQLRQPPQPTSQDADGGDRDSSGNGGDSRSAVDVLMDERLLQDRAQALEAFKATYEAQHKVEATKQLLKPKYESCKTTAQQLNACVDAMKQLKTRIQRRRAERAADGSDVVDSEETAWLEELRATKECYNTLAAQLRQDKEEIDGMHAYLKHAQEQLVRDFERWFSARQQQVQLAVQQQQRHHHAQHEKELEARQAAGLAHDLRVALDGVGGDAAALRGVHNGDNKSPLANAAETPSPPLEGNEKSEHRETPANAVHSSTSHTNAHIGNSGSGAVSAASYQALSAPIPPSVAARPYPSSAPVNSSSGNTNAVLRQPYTYAASGCVSTGEGTVPAAASLTSLPSTSSSDPPRFPATARAQNRLALLPTHMLADPAFASTPPQHPSSFSARTPEVTRHDETTSLRALGGAAATAAATLSASFPTGTAAPLLGAGKVNGWIGPAGGAGTSGAGGVGGSLTSSPTRPFHLQPLTGSPSSQRASPSPSMQQQQPPPPSNPFFPQFPSTGNAAADEQLAQLYKAREAMRKQLQ